MGSTLLVMLLALAVSSAGLLWYAARRNGVNHAPPTALAASTTELSPLVYSPRTMRPARPGEKALLRALKPSDARARWLAMGRPHVGVPLEARMMEGDERESALDAKHQVRAAGGAA